MQATVWLAPTKGRRYFNRKAAIKGEARALIYKKFPMIEGFGMNEPLCDIAEYDPERYAKLHARLCRILDRVTPQKAPRAISNSYGKVVTRKPQFRYPEPIESEGGHHD